ncbi:MAG: L,D-transpeptidase family protein [Deltaproteobacteria bacterium]|nr:L,D-transpeptidase family protein [Deltaproteobacteria bacterium]
MILTVLFAAAAECPATLPEPYASDARSAGRTFLVAKAERTLAVYEGDQLVDGTCFSTQLGPGGDDGPKTRRGDLKTPEGWYRLTHRNPNSSYYRSLGVSYPNADDVTRSLAEGAITEDTAASLRASIARGQRASQGTAMGGDIFIHGNPWGSPFDWTLGCVAVMNDEMDVLYRLGDPGTSVIIVASLP